VSNK
jgi:4-carboxymuconolactone decarboxylase